MQQKYRSASSSEDIRKYNSVLKNLVSGSKRSLLYRYIMRHPARHNNLEDYQTYMKEYPVTEKLFMNHTVLSHVPIKTTILNAVESG